jgi:hypothetical protein
MIKRAGILGAAICAGLSACGEAPVSAGFVGCTAEQRAQPSETQWVFNSAEGLDALLLIGAAAGDELQAEHYAKHIAEFRGNLSPEALEMLDALGAQFRDEGTLFGPFLVLIFTGTDFLTLEDILVSARDPEALLRPSWETTPYWDEVDWPRYRGIMPGLVLILEEMQASNFSSKWNEQVLPYIVDTIARLEQDITCYDVLPVQAQLLGRTLEPEIELVVAQYTLPYGIRVQGQRFLAHHTYPSDAFLRTAGHEIFHPPFDFEDQDLLRLLEPLQNDPWMISIVEDHDPAVGYNSFRGVVDEDSTEALDQLLATRLGIAVEPGHRWRYEGGGMHMLAAALFHAMTEEGFIDSGSNYSDWLKSALERSASPRGPDRWSGNS